MRIGFCVMANVDEIGFFTRAETLGYDSVWVTDSQMLFSDCYAVLALAARETSRLRLGPGVAICGTRIPPVHVAAMATLNRLAPGRVHLGIGTGNTAMRTMGQRPMRLAEYDEYLRVLAALLRGEVVDYSFNGVTRPVKMLMHDKEYMNLEPRIPLYVSGFGPRAMELAGKHGDGLVFAIPPRGVPVAEALAHARRGAEGAGRRFDGFRSCALTNVVLLEPGERVDSERVVHAVGPNVMASVYYFYDEVHERGVEPPPFLRPLWKRYCALVESTPPAHRHFRTHEFHYTRLHAGEAELIDAALIRATCLVGTAEELVEQIRELERQGLQELMFATGTGEKWHLAEALALRVLPRL
ncbi:MAG TPA: LLM class flavin-dependent oxidoreductase [Methylomirabilota bacterium]|jgi:alkanesulfonate monooxygenase SsuD/methylene tetrahydromethanopterin reductase-like flavin-dependent oxidoreductase (luciferase family)|nr:LLM class flavin-dependent oxidoreductase [Methylomirabilota bacterium]